MDTSTKCLVRAGIVYDDRCPNVDDLGSRDEDVFEDEAPRFTNRAAALLAKFCNVKYLSLDTRPKYLEVTKYALINVYLPEFLFD